MQQKIVITDLTQMPEGNEVCVVGISETGECIRPICAGGFQKKYLYAKNTVVIRPKARVGFDFVAAADIKPPHIEDRVSKPNSIISYGFCNDVEWEQILKNGSYNRAGDIFDGFLQDRKWVKPGAKTRSIATLSKATVINISLREEDGKLKYRLSFKDEAGNVFDYAVSDLTFRELCFKRIKKEGYPPLTLSDELKKSLKRADRIYLRLGLARPWVQPGLTEPRCYVQVTGIYSFPDYLQGRTFTDFLS